MNNETMNEARNCICRHWLGYEPRFVHLCWCPEDVGFQERVSEYDRSSWYKKPFIHNPHNEAWEAMKQLRLNQTNNSKKKLLKP